MNALVILPQSTADRLLTTRGPISAFKQPGVVPYRIRERLKFCSLPLLAVNVGILEGWVELYLTAGSAAKEAREEAGILGVVITLNSARFTESVV